MTYEQIAAMAVQNIEKNKPAIDFLFAVVGSIATLYTMYKATIWLKREIKYQKEDEFGKAFANSTESFWDGEARSCSILD